MILFIENEQFLFVSYSQVAEDSGLVLFVSNSNGVLLLDPTIQPITVIEDSGLVLYVSNSNGVLLLDPLGQGLPEIIYLFGYPTMLDILNSLKQFSISKFQQLNYRLFRSIKKGIVDNRSEYPLLAIEPEYEEIETLGSSQMFIINRKINFKIWVLTFDKLKTKSKLRKIADEFKIKLKPLLDDWMLADGMGKFQVFNIDFDAESIGDSVSLDKQWVQSYTFPVILSSYFTYPEDKVISSQVIPTDYDDLLSHIFTVTRKELKFKKFFRDAIVPNDIANLPGLYIYYDDPEANREEYSSTESIDAYINFEILSDLLTNEIALDKHLKKVYEVFNFILKYEDMGGRLELFRMVRISYGIHQFQQSKPAYSTIISTIGNFNKDLYT